MNDETEFTARNPKPPVTIPPPTPASPRNLVYWLKRLFVCNPFYLASAALLLYGMYRVSMDPKFLATEVGQLTFNFSALQGYELMLVGTAMLLAARRIWYDATLLVVLENLLLLVPFILVSQAALIEQSVVWKLCLLAVALAVGRAVWLRKRVALLMPAWRALLAGAALLTANGVLPVVYRHLHETKFGTKLASGAAYEMNEASWLWLLPALAVLANLLPRPEAERRETRLRRWFPMMLFLFWLAGTGVHLYALGYVYDFDLRAEQLAPVLWVLAWTLQTRFTDFVVAPHPAVRKTLNLLPFVATWCAIGGENGHIFFALNTLNFLGYTILMALDRGNRLALQLVLVSAAAMVAGLPAEVITAGLRGVMRTELIGVAVLAYGLINASLSRNPKLAIVGAVAAAVATRVLCGDRADGFHWAAQAGCVYFLLHSLRWHDFEHEGAAIVRHCVAGVWVLHALIWVRAGGTMSQTLTVAGLVLLAWALRGWLVQHWRPLALPVAAGLVALLSPANYAVAKTQSTPAGVLAMIGSLALFGVGTAVALTKHRWHKMG